MNYESKYLKYKQKYLSLKNNNLLQFGGDTPNINVIKNISLFAPDSVIDLHLNPIYGFLYSQLGYIDNIFNFAPDNKEFKIIKKCFHKVNNLILPTNNLHKIDIDEFAKLIAYLYLKYLFKDNIENIKKHIHTLDDLIRTLKNFNNDEFIFYKDKIIKKICNLKIDNIKFDIYSEMKYCDLIDSLSYYKTELEKIAKIPKFNSKIKEYLPDSYILEYKLQIFYIILVILWYKFDNKTGILKYYQSLNKYLLNDFKINIPADYVNTLFTYTDLINPNKDFYSVLAHVYYKNINSMQLLNYQSIEYIKKKCYSCTREACYFPDCGETTLRNFFNIIFYDNVNNNFNYKRLCELEAIDKLKEFYTKFNSLTAQTNTNKLNIFNLSLNARDAWSMVISNLPDVNYIQKCKLYEDESIYNFELKTGLSKNHIPNMLEVIKKLLKINDFEDFYEIEIINKLLDTNGHGTITFKKKSSNTEYIINIIHNHYNIEEVKEKIIDFDYTYLKEKKYIDLLLTANIHDILTDNINDFYMMNFKDISVLSTLINSYGDKIDDKKYEGIIKYIDKNWSEDDKSRTDFLLSKIPNFYEYDLGQYGINIKFTPDNKIELLMLSLLISENELQRMIELKLLEKTTRLGLGYYFNNSVDNLPNNITHLAFEYRFNQLINKLPNSLTYLKLGYQFNQLVNKLPETLTHLIFGDSFNQPVNKLPNSLEYLRFGNGFNQYVDHLPNNIKELIFGENFNRFVHNLPNSLIYLTFGYYFNQIFYRLPDDLTDLIFGKSFNQTINYLPANLTDLTFGDDFNQKVDNLPNNILYLKFGDAFNQTVDHLPNSIQILIFGSGFNKSANKLPNGILTFSYYVNNKIRLPNSLIELTILNNSEKKPIINTIVKISHTLQKINIKKEYIHLLKNVPETCIIISE